MNPVPQVPLSAALWRAAWGRRQLPTFLLRSAARYGDLIQLRPRVWLASHPSLARQILVENPGKWNKARGIEKTSRLLGDGLLGSHGEKHRARRRLLQPLFAQSRLPFYARTIVESALETRSSWQQKFGANQEQEPRVDMHAEMSVLALRIVSRAVFGAGLDAQTARIGAALDEGMRLFNGSMTPVGDFYERLPPIQKRFVHTRAELDSVVYALLSQKRAQGATGDDALSTLLRARDDAGAPLSDEDMRDEAMTLLLAGHETTANALTFAWWFLGHHAQARAKLDAELNTVLGGRDAAASDLENLPWTRAILSETMRLLPPAWIVGRCSTQQVSLQLEGREFAVPRGTTVFVSPFVLGRDRRFWHAARRFDPSRWEEGFVPEKWSYLPFGAGHRACLAENFAWMEAILSLATLAQRFRARAVGPLRLEPSVTLRPRGALWMELEKT